MAYELEAFCADARKTLKEQPGAAGREAVRKLVEKLLRNPAFVEKYCGSGAKPGIEVIHRDRDTGFNVLVHVYEKGKSGPPHDHGTSWAIYGQAAGSTVMTKWRRLDDGKKEGFANVERGESFKLAPGMAGKFEPGDIHSIEIGDGSRFVRVTGTDLNAIPTAVFNPEKKSVASGDRL